MRLQPLEILYKTKEIEKYRITAEHAGSVSSKTFTFTTSAVCGSQDQRRKERGYAILKHIRELGYDLLDRPLSEREASALIEEAERR